MIPVLCILWYLILLVVSYQVLLLSFPLLPLFPGSPELLAVIDYLSALSKFDENLQ